MGSGREGQRANMHDMKSAEAALARSRSLGDAEPALSRGAARHRRPRGAGARRSDAGACWAVGAGRRQGAQPFRRADAAGRDRPRAAASAAAAGARRADRRARYQGALRDSGPRPFPRYRRGRLRAVGDASRRRGRRQGRRDRAAPGQNPRARSGIRTRGAIRGSRHSRRVQCADQRFRAGRGRMSTLSETRPSPPSLARYAICLKGIVWREALRFLHQRERFVAALVRPLVWLFIFAAGFRQVLGVSIIPPYEVYVLYEEYITPGLMVMIQLFNGMQSSLSMVYDREMGNMRTLLVSPLPRWYLLSAKLLAGTAVSLLQVYAFLLIAWLWDIVPPPIGYLTVLPALILSGLMLGALGMLISSGIKQLENFAGVMNFVIFPMFFASSALYPLWRVEEGSPMLYYVCQFNPFTHAVELIRFALYGQINWVSLAVVGGCTIIFMIGAILAYDPSRGLIRRGPAGGET